ncbi:MAG: hypothetical protein GF331_02250, partial [Chitinivibrionales bacterium]|nr:hypothetical protein [Chitinivibrionales bacterium]
QTDNGGCGAGISPSGRYFTNNQGDHASVRIRNFNGSQLHYFAAGACSNAGSNWNRNRWSANSDDWVTFTQGYEYQLGGGHHQVLYKKDGSQCIQVQPMNRNVFYEGDDFWVGTLGPVPPAIRLDKSSLNFNAEIGGSNPGNQNVGVSNSGGGTLPTLSVSESAGWLTVNVQNNGTNSPTLVNSVNISGLGGDVYTATVTVSGNDVSSVQYTVTLTVVAPPVLDSIVVTPSNAYVAPSATQQFSAAGRDQYGNPFTLSGTVWSVTGGGTITQTGLFTAGAAEGGPHTVKATVGSIEGTTPVTIAAAPPVHLKINCGDNSPSVSGWESDQNYVVAGHTGNSYDFSCASDVSGATDPAPVDVYTTVRHMDHQYSFSDIANGTYTVRLHFTDQHDGNRLMDYTIEGVKVLDGFNIADAAGGTCKAIVKDFEVTVSDGNGLQIIAAKDNGNDVFEAAIEIIGGAPTPPSVPPVTVVSPNGGETHSVGETLTITWEWDTSITGGVAAWISVDEGETWSILTGDGSIPSHDAGTNTGSFEWVIPETFDGRSMVSDLCMVRVWEYTQNELVDISDGVFSIQAGNHVGTSTARRLPGHVCRISVTPSSELSVAVRSPGRHDITVFGLDGAVVARATAAAPRTHTFGRGHVSTGTYLVRVRTAGKLFEQAVTLVGRQ